MNILKKNYNKTQDSIYNSLTNKKKTFYKIFID
jgi:hypothetical protein